MTMAKRQFTYDYPRPAVTADIALVTNEERPRILLIRRKNEPFAGCWALPGGFVEEGERLIDAAKRELREETGLEQIDLEQLHTFGDPGRDPRGWTVTVVYMARVNANQLKPIADDDAAEAAWHPLDALPKLAFDHALILERVNRRIKLAMTQS
jgi:8-oxo-dGTP diphosphatase